MSKLSLNKVHDLRKNRFIEGQNVCAVQGDMCCSLRCICIVIAILGSLGAVGGIAMSFILTKESYGQPPVNGSLLFSFGIIHLLANLLLGFGVLLKNRGMVLIWLNYQAISILLSFFGIVSILTVWNDGVADKSMILEFCFSIIFAILFFCVVRSYHKRLEEEDLMSNGKSFELS